MKRKVYAIDVYDKLGTGEWLYGRTDKVENDNKYYNVIGGRVVLRGVEMNMDEKSKEKDKLYKVKNCVEVDRYIVCVFNICTFYYDRIKYYIKGITWSDGDLIYYITERTDNYREHNGIESRTIKGLRDKLFLVSDRDKFSFDGDNEKKFLDIFNMDSINE